MSAARTGEIHDLIAELIRESTGEFPDRSTLVAALAEIKESGIDYDQYGLVVTRPVGVNHSQWAWLCETFECVFDAAMNEVTE